MILMQKWLAQSLSIIVLVPLLHWMSQDTYIPIHAAKCTCLLDVLL